MVMYWGYSWDLMRIYPIEMMYIMGIKTQVNGYTCHNGDPTMIVFKQRKHEDINHGDMLGINWHSRESTELPAIKSPFLIWKPSINGPFSMAMFNNQKVCMCVCVYSTRT